MKISIITINKNNASGLRRTIESVVCQTVQPYEFIVIDGASSDESPSLLVEFDKNVTYSISEQDNGIYNAMNKGVAHATGEWCLFLNSGDTLYDENVILKLQESGCDADIICGSTFLMCDPPKVKDAHKEISLYALCDKAICHQSALIRTSLLKKHPYDESLKIVSDRKFFVQSLILDNCAYQSTDIIIAKYDLNGFSSNNPLLSGLEWQGVLSELIPSRILVDYGRKLNGCLFSEGVYGLFFMEISRRRYKQSVYQIVRGMLLLVSLFIPSAGFVKLFPVRCK